MTECVPSKCGGHKMVEVDKCVDDDYYTTVV